MVSGGSWHVPPSSSSSPPWSSRAQTGSSNARRFSWHPRGNCGLPSPSRRTRLRRDASSRCLRVPSDRRGRFCASCAPPRWDAPPPALAAGAERAPRRRGPGRPGGPAWRRRGGARRPAGGPRRTWGNQFRHTRESLAPIVDLAQAGWHIVLVHGNGPQVGDELARNEIAADQVEPLPLGVLVAGTAGWMGYMIQQSLQNALARAGVRRTVVTLITQTLCDADDPNLRTPSKPIGHALDAVRGARPQARGGRVRDEKPGQWRRARPRRPPSGTLRSAP